MPEKDEVSKPDFQKVCTIEALLNKAFELSKEINSSLLRNSLTHIERSWSQADLLKYVIMREEDYDDEYMGVELVPRLMNEEGITFGNWKMQSDLEDTAEILTENEEHRIVHFFCNGEMKIE